MTYDEAIARFGTQTRLANVLGITQSTVSCWERVIPPKYQFQLQVLTGGALLVDDALLRAPARVAAEERPA